MNHRIKWLLALSLLLFLSLSFSASAQPELTRYYSVPASMAYSSQVQWYASDDGTFLLLSSDGSQTKLCQLNALNGEFSLIYTDSLPYTAACLQDGRLYLAFSTMDYSAEWGEFIRSTKMLVYSLAEDTQKSFWISDLYLSSNTSLAVDSSQTIYAFDSNDSHLLRTFNSSGIPLETVSLDGALTSLTSSPEGERVYLTFSDSTRFFSFAAGSPQELVPSASEAPLRPYHFFNSQTYVDGAGDVYAGDEQGFSLVLSTLCPTPSPISQGDFIYYLPSDGPLLCMDAPSKEVIAEFPMELSNPVALAQSEEYCGVLAPEKDGWRIGVASLFSPQPVTPVVHTPASNQLSISQMKQLWQDCLPQNIDPSQTYSVPADLLHFSHPGTLASQTINDGVKAVEFYRTLYGLPAGNLQAEKCTLLQYGAVLSLFASAEGELLQPEGMNDAFYQTAVSAYEKSWPSVLYGSTGYPIAQAIHLQIEQCPSFRHQLLANQDFGFSFGSATSDNQSSVLISMSTPQNQDMISYPQPGSFPLGLLQQDAVWSVQLGELIPGLRGPIRVVVTDQSTRVQTIRTENDGLFLDGNTLSWRPPDDLQEHTYEITVEGLCTSSGRPAQIYFSTSLFSMDTSFPVLPDPPGEQNQIGSSIYSIDRASGIISGIAPSTSLAVFKRGLTGDGSLEIFKNGTLHSNGNIGTGMTVRLVRDHLVLDELTVLITGDMTGEGNINTLDLRTLCNALLEEKNLNGLFLTAADINHDGIVDTLDLLALSYYLSEEYDITQK